MTQKATVPMENDSIAVTPAIRVLRQHDVVYTNPLYAYEERGGTAASARELRVPEHAIVKTLVMADDARQPLSVDERAALSSAPHCDVPQ